MSLSVTVVLVVLTVLASLYAWNRPDIMEKWMMNPYRVDKRREYYRFFTSGFIHADYIHLAFNMLALYSFGEAMERVFAQIFADNGTWVFLALYLLGIVASDVPTYYKHRNHSHYNSLGASGGVSSVVFAFILFYPQAQLGFLFIPIPIPAFLFGALYMLYSVYMARRGGDYINHDAHLWGALFGIVFSIVMFPPVVGLFLEQVLPK